MAADSCHPENKTVLEHSLWQLCITFLLFLFLENHLQADFTAVLTRTHFSEEL